MRGVNTVKPCLLLCALVPVICASVGWSQPAPDTILLPDSLGPLRPGYHLAFGSSTDNIYVASESADIIVVDGNTYQRSKRINTGTPVGGALLVSRHNKLYCSYPQQGRVGIIDCATNTAVGSIQVGTRPTLLCYSSGSDKLYCGDTIDRAVSVMDCATNEVLKVIPAGASPTVLGYEPTTNKVYAGTRDALLAISCPADTIVATIPSIKGARGLCVNKHRQKVYVVGPDSSWHLGVVSTVSDSVIAAMPAGGFVSPLLVCNEVTDRLYAVSGADLYEFDCVGDTYVDYCEVGEGARGLVGDSVHNRLYYLSEGSGSWLSTVDCANMQRISVIRVHDYAAILEADPARYRVMYAGGQWESVLTVFDNKGDSLHARGGTSLCGWKYKLWRNTAEDKLYFRWGRSFGGIGVIDEQTRRVTKLLFLPQAAEDTLVYCRTGNKAYFLAMAGLGVLDGASDSLLRVKVLGNGYVIPCYCPDENKIYYCTSDGPRLYMAAIDCGTDSVVWEKDVYYPVAMQYLGNHRLLCWEPRRLYLLDTRNDSVLIDTAVAGRPYALAHTGDGQKVYIDQGIMMEVLDASTLSLLATIDWDYRGPEGSDAFLMCSDSTGKLYWFIRNRADQLPDSILAIDTRGDSVVARLGAGLSQFQGCMDHTGRYIFNPNPYDSTLILYDTRADSLAENYQRLPVPRSATSNPEQHRIYVGCQDLVLVYPDMPPGVEETPNVGVRAASDGPTVVKCGLIYTPTSSKRRPSMGELLDVSGRKAMDLQPGENDVRGLAPGVYFVREAQAQAQAVRKVVLTE
jgi:DNA-binding beta-propeller fold protein YncE